jgi:hypothetical protein
LGRRDFAAVGLGRLGDQVPPVNTVFEFFSERNDYRNKKLLYTPGNF